VAKTVGWVEHYTYATYAKLISTSFTSPASSCIMQASLSDFDNSRRPGTRGAFFFAT
jgi:hypothetical protein